MKQNASRLPFVSLSHSRHPITMPRGAFIVLEGLDRSGKSTQVDRLVARLEASGRKARVQKFPGELGLRVTSKDGRE